MFCTKCGKENNNNAAFCSGCGSDLNVMRQATAAPVYTAAPVSPEPSRGKKIFVKVLNIVSGFTGLCTALMLLLPQIVLPKEGSLNFIEIFVNMMDHNVRLSFGGGEGTIVFFFLAFLVTTVFYIVWMIMSLAQRRSAGAWGIVSNGLMQVNAFMWYTALMVVAKDSTFKGYITIVPLSMITASTQGLAMSIVQLIFRNMVRPKPTVEEKTRKTKGAKVIFYICAGIGALNALTAFLPTLNYRYEITKTVTSQMTGKTLIRHTYTDDSMSMVQLVGKTFSGEITGNAVPIVVMFFISIALLLAWAVLSVLKKPFAGAVGLVASIFALVYPVFSFTFFTPLNPDDAWALMLLLSIAGIVLASIQIAKRRKV